MTLGCSTQRFSHLRTGFFKLSSYYSIDCYTCSLMIILDSSSLGASGWQTISLDMSMRLASPKKEPSLADVLTRFEEILLLLSGANVIFSCFFLFFEEALLCYGSAFPSLLRAYSPPLLLGSIQSSSAISIDNLGNHNYI